MASFQSPAFQWAHLAASSWGGVIKNPADGLKLLNKYDLYRLMDECGGKWLTQSIPLFPSEFSNCFLKVLNQSGKKKVSPTYLPSLFSLEFFNSQGKGMSWVNHEITFLLLYPHGPMLLSPIPNSVEQ